LAGISMTVIDKHRIIKERWTLGGCGNCGHNPEHVRMARERMVSGDAGKSKRSETEVWVCPRCGYCRKL